MIDRMPSTGRPRGRLDWAGGRRHGPGGVLHDGVEDPHSDRLSSGSVLGSLLLIVLAILALAVQGISSGPVRPAVVLGFVAFGPGWAILRLWSLASGWAGLALVLSVSLGLAMVVSGGMLYAGVWSPLASLAVLAGITVVAACVSLARHGGARSVSSARWRMAAGAGGRQR
jgi:hypothetical protein